MWSERLLNLRFSELVYQNECQSFCGKLRSVQPVLKERTRWNVHPEAKKIQPGLRSYAFFTGCVRTLKILKSTWISKTVFKVLKRPWKLQKSKRSLKRPWILAWQTWRLLKTRSSRQAERQFVEKSLAKSWDRSTSGEGAGIDANVDHAWAGRSRSTLRKLCSSRMQDCGLCGRRSCDTGTCIMALRRLSKALNWRWKWQEGHKVVLSFAWVLPEDSKLTYCMNHWRDVALLTRCSGLNNTKID